MTVLDDSIGEHLRCDRCGVEFNGDDDYYENVYFPYKNWLRTLFEGRPDCPTYPDFCRTCYQKLIPTFLKLRDVSELRLYVNLLERAIRERKRQNNRATTDDASQRSKSSIERRHGHRSSNCSTQISKEHQRILVLGNKDCNVSPRGWADGGEVWLPRSR